MRHLSHVSSWKLFCDLHLQSFHVHWRFFFSLVCFSSKCAKRESGKVKEGSELESGWPSLQQRNAESSQQQSSWVLVTVSLDYQWQPTEKVCASEPSPPQSLAASTHRWPCVSIWSVREGERLSVSSACVCARVSESESVWACREISRQHIHVGRGNSAAVFKPGFKPECLQLLQHTSGFFQSSGGGTEPAISSFIIILSSVNLAHKLSKYHSSQGQNSKILTSTWKFFHHDLTCGTAQTVPC